ncbi:hypothetical protein H310_07752 [Aphanomyces invadans]|uniref:Ketoreductase (KR) domain-containing protein n=1 Tax=Aphanomyces invadans TaxID=157072 RepID=A0A024U238_9STRA|nr:hypothetical protein H310_07752 [Aphanomyces invadans]ETV99687.1 hypothetical protein H310_07752 [Aphanomyces invadans]|eukprot:XP_008871463.1 hypothetical protein H310_07752 [Aphanomyces invadans]
MPASRLAFLKQKNGALRFPGQTAFLVGATSGIGEGIARRLAKAEFNVIIAGRNAGRGATVVKELKSMFPGGDHQFVSLDAQYIGGIRGLSHQLPQVDKLILTQGIATLQGRTLTSEGIDQKMALHYYGRMALIQEFLPRLRQSTQSPRVLSVFSAGVHKPYEGYREDPDLRHSYTLQNAANAAGFYNDLMLDAWSQEDANAGIAFAHAAPGIVATNWGTEMPWAVRMALKPLKHFLAKSPDDCAEFMCDFLLDASAFPPMSGVHLIDQHAGVAKKTSAHTPEAAAFIYHHTLSVLDQAEHSHRE